MRAPEIDVVLDLQKVDALAIQVGPSTVPRLHPCGAAHVATNTVAVYTKTNGS